MAYPESADVFTNLDATSYVASSDPNAIADSLENTQGFIGSMGKPQSWSTALLTCLRRYRRGMEVVIKSDNLIYVRAGEAVLEDTNAAKRVMRQNTTDIAITTSHLDTGTMAVTYYFVYAKAGSAATTAPIVISTDPVAPSASAIGTIPFLRLGWFYNAIAAAIAATWCGNEKIGSEDILNIARIEGTSNVASAVAIATIPDLWLKFYSFGRPVKLYLTASIWKQNVALNFRVDGVSKSQQILIAYTPATSQYGLATMMDIYNLDAGPHTIEVEWGLSTNSTITGATYPPILIAEEV